MSHATSTDQPPAFGLSHDAWGQLVLIDAEGMRHEGVTPVRGFPISDPDHWISICDSAGRELVCLESLATLAPAVRETLVEALTKREFVPIVRRIVRASSDTEPSEWDVETDRGPTRFVLNTEDDVRRLGPYSGMIIDSHGIRYLISDMRRLDATSRRILEAYL